MPKKLTLAKRVQLDLATQGWTKISTRKFFSRVRVFPEQKSHRVYGNERAEIGQIRLTKYINYIDKLIRKVIEAEDWNYNRLYLEYRYEHAKYKSQYDNFHKDGAYFRAICSLEGITTEFQNPNGTRFAPQLFETIVFTGMNRARHLNVESTSHRGRRNKKPRKLLVIGWD